MDEEKLKIWDRDQEHGRIREQDGEQGGGQSSGQSTGQSGGQNTDRSGGQCDGENMERAAGGSDRGTPGKGKRPAVVRLIQEGYASLSRRQALLADFIVSHCDEAAFMTAAALGEAAGVSEATVLRFAQVLGFDGYAALQAQLKNEVLSRVNVTRRMEQTYADVDRSRLLDEVLETDMLLFARTRQMISEKAFNLAVDLIESARDIYIVGLRGSAPLAQYLHFHLRLIFNHVILVTSSSEHELLEQMIHVDEEDTVIGISFPRYSLRTLRLLEFANARRAGIITLTDSMRAPVNLYSTCTLTAAADISSVAGSLTAAMGVVDALITSLSVRNSAAVEKNMELLEHTLQDYQVSGSDEMDMMEQGVQLHFPLKNDG